MKNDERYFIEDVVQYPEKLQKIHNDLPFLLERKKKKNLKNFQSTFMLKENMSYT